MKLDVNVLRYLSKEEFRVLTAVEMGMKNVRVLLAASLPTWKLSLLNMNKVELADDCLLLLLSLGGGENSFLWVLVFSVQALVLNYLSQLALRCVAAAGRSKQSELDNEGGRREFCCASERLWFCADFLFYLYNVTARDCASRTCWSNCRPEVSLSTSLLPLLCVGVHCWRITHRV